MTETKISYKVYVKVATNYWSKLGTKRIEQLFRRFPQNLNLWMAENFPGGDLLPRHFGTQTQVRFHV
jgi:hypothetical protein